MTWHYQVMETDGFLGIHEYFVDEDGESWTEEPVTVGGEDVEAVLWTLERMMRDVKKHGIKQTKPDKEEK